VKRLIATLFVLVFAVGTMAGCRAEIEPTDHANVPAAR
jgi:hypothetical protein